MRDLKTLKKLPVCLIVLAAARLFGIIGQQQCRQRK